LADDETLNRRVRSTDIEVMSQSRAPRIYMIGLWSAAIATLLAASVTNDSIWLAPQLLFWLVVVGAGCCVVMAAFLVRRAFAAASAETALFGSFVWAVSILPLAHGFLTPGVLYDSNQAFVTTVQLAIPIAAIAVLPLAAPRSRWANSVVAHWRALVPVHMAIAAATSAAFLVWPHAVPAVPGKSAAAVVLAAASVAAVAALSWRHARLAELSGSRGPLAVSTGLVLVGSVPVIFIAADGFGLAFWLAHLFDICGVLVAGVAALVTYRREGTLSDVLAVVEATTPLHALEIGLDDVVHRFVADLDTKDKITRDHVVRTAQLAVEVSTELRLPPADVRLNGIGAILHDVGKLTVPDEILTKAGRLTADEFAVIQSHAQAGADLVAASPVLDGITEIVRGHHERFDGGGYPQGLAGEGIPLGARIVSVCDAYDAMANTRQYREGMGRERALAVLREHAGAQWDASVVAALERVVVRHEVLRGEALDGGVLDRVGRNTGDDSHHHWCSCRDALPSELAAAGTESGR
jgi:putative nucleotidyltransferase with HDIG domain